MLTAEKIQVCRSCGSTVPENYCTRCGEPYKIKRITLKGILHDVFHLFTHLDKGFAFTTKRLVLAPGYMQKEYVAGERNKHQKPFSMFFICATLAAFIRYWIYKILAENYHTGNITEANFFHEYMVLLHTALLPIHALIVYLLFKRSRYNYAEVGVMVLYSVAFLFFLAATLISFLKFIWPSLDTAYIELPILVFYTLITYLNFFDDLRKWEVALKSVFIIITLFFLIQLLEDFAVELIS